MFNLIKQTGKHTIIYSLGNLSTKLVGIVLLALYSSYINIADYGEWALFDVIIQVCITVFTLNIPLAMIRWSGDEEDPYKQKEIVFTSLVGTFVIATIVGIIIYLQSEFLSEIIFQQKKYTEYFQWLSVTIVFGIFSHIPLNLMRLREKSLFFSFVMISKFVLIMIFNIYLIAYLDMGIEGIIISLLIGHVYNFLICLPLIIKNSVFSFNRIIFNEMLKYGLPLVFSSSATLIFNFTDRFLIKFFLDEEKLGVYSLAQRVGGFINVFLIQSFSLGFLPIAFKNMKQSNASRFFSKTLTYFTLSLVLFALFLSLFSKELLTLFSQNKDYIEAYKYIPLITLVFVFRGINYMFQLAFHFTKKTKYLAYITLGGAVLNISLNILLLKLFDIYGAVFSMLITFITLSFIYKYYSQKLYPINFEIKKVVTVILTSILLFSLSMFLDPLNIYLRVISKLTLIVSLPFILYQFNFYEDVEINKIKELYLKFKNPKSWKSNIKDLLK